jgi:hypothetical protein
MDPLQIKVISTMCSAECINKDGHAISANASNCTNWRRTQQRDTSLIPLVHEFLVFIKLVMYLLTKACIPEINNRTLDM